MINIDSYKSALEALHKTLTLELSDIAVHNHVTDDWEIRVPKSIESDEDIRADAAESADEQVAELAELETRYRSVTRALEKIAQGTYGLCEIDGKTIEEDRLAANPAARTCKAHMETEYELPQS